MVYANCWEALGCGREPGGPNADEMGVCPASTETRLHGMNHGTNAGRACWVIAGTMCAGEAVGTFASKRDCLTCRFYLRVVEEEGQDFVFTPGLLRRLDGEEEEPPGRIEA